MKVDEFGQEQELQMSKPDKTITSEVFSGYRELFLKTATKSILTRGAVQTMNSVMPSVEQILSKPMAIDAKVDNLKYKLPTDRYFLFYHLGNNQYFGLVPNRAHSLKIQSLKQRIAQLQKQNQKVFKQTVDRLGGKH